MRLYRAGRAGEAGWAGRALAGRAGEDGAEGFAPPDRIEKRGIVTTSLLPGFELPLDRVLR